MPTVADTDLSLWTFHELVVGPEGDSSRFLEFESDEWVTRRRAACFLRPFVRDHTPLEQARFLAEIDPLLAAKIAGTECERIVKEAGLKYLPRVDPDVPFRDIVPALYNANQLSLPDREELFDVWRKRNLAVHHSGDVTPEEVEKMNQTASAVGSKWHIAEKRRIAAVSG